MSKLTPIKSNYKKLDSLIEGFVPGEVTVIGARPSVGKTAFLLSLIKNITVDSYIPGLFFSLELPIQMIHIQMVFSMTKISFLKYRNDELNENEAKRWTKARNQIQDSPLIINDKSTLNINEICDEARKQYMKNAFKIMYIDYLGLIASNNDKLPVYEQITCNLKTLKALALELNVPIIITYQLARELTKNPPEFSHTLGSGDVKSIADVILLLHRNLENRCSTKLYVDKNHNGRLGTVDFDFYQDFVSFDETV